MARTNEANQQADYINLELAEQIEKLDNIHNHIKETQVILQKANELIKYFLKTIYTDKILMFLLVLNVLVISTIIGLQFAGIDPVQLAEDAIN